MIDLVVRLEQRRPDDAVGGREGTARPFPLHCTLQFALDNPHLQEKLIRVLEDQEHTIVDLETQCENHREITQEKVDLVLVAVPGGSGGPCIRDRNACTPRPPLILS